MSNNRTSSNRIMRCGGLFSRTICIILMLLNGYGLGYRNIVEGVQHAQKRGVADSFSEGIKYAGQMFGINTAADVANLVAKAFSNMATSEKKPDFLLTLLQQRRQQQQQATSAESNEVDTASYEQQQQETQQQTGEQQQQQTAGSAPPPPPAKENLFLDFSSAKLVTSMLRMIGFDASKLGALAINALIMIAQAIGSTLLSTFTRKPGGVSVIDGGRLFMNANSSTTAPERDAYTDDRTDYQPRMLRDGTPLDWFLQNPTKQMNKLLAQATDVKLAEQLTDMIAKVESRNIDGGSEHSAACLKMLVCKSAPFIWGMQKSLKQRIKGEENAKESSNEYVSSSSSSSSSIVDTSVFFTHLPTIDEFREHGTACEERYATHCDTNELVNNINNSKRSRA